MKADKQDHKNIKKSIDKQPEPVVILDSMGSIVNIQTKKVNYLLNENEVKDYIETAIRYLGEIGYEVVSYTYAVNEEESLDISFSIRINNITEACNILNHPVPIRFQQSKDINDIITYITWFFGRPNNYLQSWIGETILYTTCKTSIDTVDIVLYDFLEFVFTLPVYHVPSITTLDSIILNEIRCFMIKYDDERKKVRE